jgi:sec-independent protein translocase protein TatA
MAFFSVGPLEIAVLAVIALLVLGPKKLPEAARSVGKGMREMRNAMSGATSFKDEDEELEDEGEAEDEPVPSPS